jgi:hypothetical protein
LLRTHLVELYHDACSSPGTARATLNAELSDPAGRNLLGQRSFSVSVPVASYDAAGAVQGIRPGARPLLDEVAAWAGAGGGSPVAALAPFVGIFSIAMSIRAARRVMSTTPAVGANREERPCTT